MSAVWIDFERKAKIQFYQAVLIKGHLNISKIIVILQCLVFLDQFAVFN
jgi:hypothetical protein